MPMRLLLCTLCGAAVLAASLTTQAAAEVDVAALAADLDSDRFQAREKAEQALVEAGTALVLELLKDGGPPGDVTDAAASAHLAGLETTVRQTLQTRLYDHLERQQSLEARYRAERIRTAVERTVAARLGKLRARYPVALPAEAMEKVHGYTGGFRDGTSWFDTTFQNSSAYTVTSIRIFVRLTHKETGETTERLATLGAGQAPLRPGQSANWSADVKMKRSRQHEFYWETREIYGLPPQATAD